MGKLTPYFVNMEKNATKIVTGALLGLDFKTVIVNGKAYVIQPPTIHKLSGAAYHLAELGEADTIRGVLSTLSKIENGAKALSYLIKGDDSLTDELAQGTFDEVVEALDIAFSLVSAENFIKLSGLAKNVQSLIAKQR